MSKAKNLANAIGYLLNKRVRIYTDKKLHWADATVVGLTGLYLILKDVEIWNGMKRVDDSIHVQWVKRIEQINNKPCGAKN